MPLAKYPDQRPDGRRRARRGDGAIVAPSVRWPPLSWHRRRWPGRRRRRGLRREVPRDHLVLKGFLAGTLKVPAFLPPGKILTGCQISPSQTGTIVLQWDSAKLKVNGQAKTLKNIDVQVTVAKFGHSYSMKLNSYGETPASITFQSNMPFGWSSVSGTLTTTKSGDSGSVSASMSAGKAHSGTVSVKGNWAGCANLG